MTVLSKTLNTTYSGDNFYLQEHPQPKTLKKEHKLFSRYNYIIPLICELLQNR